MRERANHSVHDKPNHRILQVGHRRTMSGKFYHELWPRTPVKPFLEAEASYEGFASETVTVDAARIRHTAYVAMQCGSFGFTYSAQGIYSSELDRSSPGSTAKWGPVKTWDEGLQLPGGAQMLHLRACYKSVEWWKLQPLPTAVESAAGLFVKADGTQTAQLYFPAKIKVAQLTRLKAVPATARYEANGLTCAPASGRNSAPHWPQMPKDWCCHHARMSRTGC